MGNAYFEIKVVLFSELKGNIHLQNEVVNEISRGQLGINKEEAIGDEGDQWVKNEWAIFPIFQYIHLY